MEEGGDGTVRKASSLRTLSVICLFEIAAELGESVGDGQERLQRARNVGYNKYLVFVPLR